MSGRLRWLVRLSLASIVFPSAAHAHRLDEYLQATLVVIDPGEVLLQINLTPGMEISGQILFLLDRDRDGAISENEAAAYGDVLKHDLVVRLDGRPVALKTTETSVPSAAEIGDGSGIIQMEFSFTPGPLAVGTHRLSVENRHLAGLGVYLFNAAQPESGDIQIASQTRSPNQSQGEISFTYAPSTADAPSVPPRSISPRIGGVAMSLAALLVAAFAVVLRRSRRDR